MFLKKASLTFRKGIFLKMIYFYHHRRRRHHHIHDCLLVKENLLPCNYYCVPQGFKSVGTGSSRLITVSRLVSTRDSHSHSSTGHSCRLLQVTEDSQGHSSQHEQCTNPLTEQHRSVSVQTLLLSWLVYRKINIK